jgi:hypothetical protein
VRGVWCMVGWGTGTGVRTGQMEAMVVLVLVVVTCHVMVWRDVLCCANYTLRLPALAGHQSYVSYAMHLSVARWSRRPRLDSTRLVWSGLVPSRLNTCHAAHPLIAPRCTASTHCAALRGAGAPSPTYLPV